ncbi:MAG TPA: hypothetical protein VJT73_17610 [Polyangiaceae bacterium]|nr:hypothetical protein [Polyangiaceae bacterium]
MDPKNTSKETNVAAEAPNQTEHAKPPVLWMLVPLALVVLAIVLSR